MITLSNSGAIKQYSQVSVNLVAGNNLITHNLGLAFPFLVAVTIKGSNGSQISAFIKNETANTCVISLVAGINNVSIKII